MTHDSMALYLAAPLFVFAVVIGYRSFRISFNATPDTEETEE